MRVIYVSGPLTGDGTRQVVWENTMRAREIAILLWELGAAPICPHLNTLFMDGTSINYEKFIEGDKELVKRSDGVVRLPGESEGADIETELAAALKIPVLFLKHSFILASLTSNPWQDQVREFLKTL